MRASDSGQAILNGVNVRNMLMEFLAANSDGHDTCCVTGGQQVWKLGVFPRYDTVIVTVKVYHCANGDRRFDGQNWCRSLSPLTQ